MILGILIFLSSITMFKDIDMNDYNLEYELQRSYFLYDCLFEEISFTFEDRPKKNTKIYPPPIESQFIIYKKSDNGISEEICLDELIFYIHTEVADEIQPIYLDELKKATESRYINYKPNKTIEPIMMFSNLFKDIDTIRKTVENMKIILKYDKNINKNEESKDDEKETDDEKPLMKIISTKPID